jgi:phosphatidyl-myo-inositol dimannoside synthase
VSSRRPQSVLIVSSEFAIDPDGTYRPGGLQLFARCVVASLVGAPGVLRVAAWGLLDSQEGMDVFRTYHIGKGSEVSVRGFGGNRAAMLASFALQHWAYDLVIFLHVGMARIALLRFGLPHSAWIVGVEVRRPLTFTERLAFQTAAPLLSISKYSSDEMLKHNPGLRPGIPVHLSVEPDGPWSKSSPIPDGETYDASTRRKSVLIVARMSASERYKGHDQLISAWPAVVQSCPGAELLITGTGDDEPRLRKMANALGPAVSTLIQFLGRVGHEELIALYRTTRVFAMPSTGEGFGLVFAEAMKYGVPCICSFDSAQEIVIDGHTGLVVKQEPNEIAAACVKLLSDDGLADHFSREGHLRFLDEYTFEGMCDRVRQAYGVAEDFRK